jgi:hypothetical protein
VHAPGGDGLPASLNPPMGLRSGNPSLLANPGLVLFRSCRKRPDHPAVVVPRMLLVLGHPQRRGRRVRVHRPPSACPSPPPRRSGRPRQRPPLAATASLRPPCQAIDGPELIHRISIPPCSLALPATSQQYFSLRTNQLPTTSQQYFSLRTNQH